MLTDILLANVPVNPKTNIDKNSGYTVVYPEGSVNSAAYPAVQLANALSLTLSTESAGDSAKEIVIIDENLGKKLTTPTGKYNVKRDGNKIIITAGDMFGFVGATEFITEKLIKNGTMSFFETLNYNGTYTGDMRETREGTNRVMFHNIWCQDPGVSGIGLNRTDENYIKLAKASIEYELALVAAYQPDVIGFNEYWEGYRKLTSTVEPTKTELVYRMEQMGYGCVYLDATGSDEDNILFYNMDTVTFNAGSERWLSYGALVKNGDADDQGWYYDSSESGMGALVANFTDKTTGKRFNVCATHFESNGVLDAPQVAPRGNFLRILQGQKLVTFLKEYQKTYADPIIVGGDYNSQDSYSAGTYPDGATSEVVSEGDARLTGVCDYLRAQGFVNAYDQAGKTAQATSCHGYPVWNAALERFVGYNSSLDVSESAYKGSIDHIYVYDTNDVIEECDYWNVIDKPVLSASDHKAILLDFNID